MFSSLFSCVILLFMSDQIPIKKLQWNEITRKKERKIKELGENREIETKIQINKQSFKMQFST